MWASASPVLHRRGRCGAPTRGARTDAGDRSPLGCRPVLALASSSSLSAPSSSQFSSSSSCSLQKDDYQLSCDILIRSSSSRALALSFDRTSPSAVHRADCGSVAHLFVPCCWSCSNNSAIVNRAFWWVLQPFSFFFFLCLSCLSCVFQNSSSLFPSSLRRTKGKQKFHNIFVRLPNFVFSALW